MNLSYRSVFEKFNTQLTAVEKRVHGQLSPQSRTAHRAGADTPAAEIAFLTARLSRSQEELNRLTRTVNEKELALECNALQLQRNADEEMRLERDAAALRMTLADEQNRSAGVLRENERLKNEMRFFKAELDYRLGLADASHADSEEAAELLKEKDGEIARLFARLKAVEEEREELNAQLTLASLRHRSLRAGGPARPTHRRGALRRFFTWLTKPMIVIGHIPD